MGDDREPSPIEEALETMRDTDPEWIDFALESSRRIEDAFVGRNVSARDAVGGKLFLLSCLADYYFLCRHYDLTSHPYEFAGEIPLSGDRWFRYTELSEGPQLGEIIDNPVVSGDEVPRASLVVSDLAAGVDPDMDGYLLPRNNDGVGFDEIIRDLLPEYVEGFRCHRESDDRLVFSWGMHTFGEFVDQGHSNLWNLDVAADTGRVN